MSDKFKEFFGRVNGDVVYVFHNSGDAATRLDANIYPVGSDVSARYEHPEGLCITVEDALKIGLTII